MDFYGENWGVGGVFLVFDGEVEDVGEGSCC